MKKRVYLNLLLLFICLLFFLGCQDINEDKNRKHNGTDKGTSNLKYNISEDNFTNKTQPSNFIEPQKPEKIVISPSKKQITIEIEMAEIEIHNIKEDCWVVVEDKVYDITEYLAKNPDAQEVIYCGGLAKIAPEKIEQFYLGDLHK